MSDAPNPAPDHFNELTWPAAERAGTAGFVAILPVGSTEAHGPHLPLGTDVIIAEGMACAAADLLRSRGCPVHVLPPLSYVVTDCAAGFAGTISVSREAVLLLLRDVAASLRHQGARVLCFANAHLEPAHRATLQQACQDFSTPDFAVVFPDKVRKPTVLQLGEEFRSGACHAGQYETSLVLALRPELVDEERRAQLTANWVSLGKALAEGKKTFEEAGGPEAYFGDPAAASAEEGRERLATLARMVADQVEAALP